MKSRLKPRVQVRIFVDGSLPLGPGKAAMLAQINAEGSISGASRAMGMSYKKAWYLVHHMNCCFNEPLVVADRGGAKGGARLTPMGHKVLALYQAIQAGAEKATLQTVCDLAALVHRRAH